MTQIVLEVLQEIVKEAETQFRVKAIKYASSERVKNSIESSSKKTGESSFVITVLAKGKIAVFRELGTKRHDIDPRNHPVLVFHWDKAYDYIPRTKDGRVILKHVDHPGSKADNEGKGYLRPASRETVQFLKKEIPSKLGQAVVTDIKRSIKVTK